MASPWIKVPLNMEGGLTMGISLWNLLALSKNYITPEIISLIQYQDGNAPAEDDTIPSKAPSEDDIHGIRVTSPRCDVL